MHTEEIRIELLKMECPKHQTSPTIVIAKRELQVAACCPEFRKTVIEKLKYLKEKYKPK